MKEKWVQINKIQGFEEVKDCYYLSNSDEDKIMNRNTGKLLKPWIDRYGYKKFCLVTTNGKRSYKIHILKAKAFLFSPNPLGVNVVRHLNDCKTNNTLTNLTWGSYSDNMQDCIRNGKYNHEAAARGRVMGVKKVSKPVRCIETGIIYSSAYNAECQTGISNSHIGHCCRGQRQIAGGFHWEYID